MNKIISELLNKNTLGGVCAGWATMAWFLLPEVNIDFRYETYGMFLMFISLYFLAFWWYPIYIENKEGPNE
jgi:hypothetical protein